jgi:hypothetical protein
MRSRGSGVNGARIHLPPTQRLAASREERDPGLETYGADQEEIEVAGLSFILGANIPHVPAPSPGTARAPRRQILTGTSSPSAGRPGRPAGHRGQVTSSRFRTTGARRTRHGVDV